MIGFNKSFAIFILNTNNATGIATAEDNIAAMVTLTNEYRIAKNISPLLINNNKSLNTSLGDGTNNGLK